MMPEEAPFENRAWARNNRISGTPIAPLIPAQCFEDGLLVNSDGSFGLGWQCVFPYISLLGDNKRERLYEAGKTLLNGLHEDYDLQFIWMTSRRSAEITTEIVGEKATSGLIRDYALEQRDILERSFKSGDSRWIDCYVYLVRPRPFGKNQLQSKSRESRSGEEPLVHQNPVSRMLERLRSSLSPAPAEITYQESTWEKVTSDFFSQADSLHASLEDLGASPKVLSPDGMLQVFYRYWNNLGWDIGGRPRRFDPESDISLTDHFLTGGPEVLAHDGMLSLDGRHHIIAALRTPPERLVFPQFAASLVHGNLPNLTHVLTLRHASLKSREALLRRRVPELREAAKKSPANKTAFEEAFREQAELGRGTEKVWTAQSVFMVSGDTPEAAKHDYLMLRKAAEVSAGMHLEAERYAALDYFIAAHPGWTRDRDHFRHIPYSSTQLATQLPIYGQPGGFFDGKGARLPVGAIHQTTAGTLVNFFPHDKRFSNYNVMVFGKSGSGKGVIINDFIAQIKARQPARFNIIDVDASWKKGSSIPSGSYRKTCEALAGSYVEMSLSVKGRVMNPLYTEGNHFPDNDEIDAMVRFLEKILSDPANTSLIGLPTETKTLIEEMLLQTFRAAQGRKEVTLSDFRDLLANNPRSESLARKLGRWTGSGSYANLFDGPNQLDVSNWLTVFDLSAVRENTEVCPIMFSVIFGLVAQLATRYARDIKYLVFDECAEFLKDPMVAAYIEKSYRQMRKAGVGVIGMSQSLDEWINTGSGSGFINNTDHIICLEQRSSDSANLIADSFKFSADERACLTRLKSVPGEFSQALILQAGQGGWVSNIVVKRPTPLGYAMASSHPADRAAFEELRKTGMTYGEAVRQFAQRYPHGAFRATMK